jgi:hypothetical protein
MYLPKQPKVLTELEIKQITSICENQSRGAHCNWCHFTYKEVQSLLLTIDSLKQEIDRLKNVSKSY